MISTFPAMQPNVGHTVTDLGNLKKITSFEGDDKLGF